MATFNVCMGDSSCTIHDKVFNHNNLLLLYLGDFHHPSLVNEAYLFDKLWVKHLYSNYINVLTLHEYNRDIIIKITKKLGNSIMLTKKYGQFFRKEHPPFSKTSHTGKVNQKWLIRQNTFCIHHEWERIMREIYSVFRKAMQNSDEFCFSYTSTYCMEEGASP